MPNYYNPYIYNSTPVPGTNYYSPYSAQPMSYNATSYGMPGNNYWISVDGEMAARAWQMPSNLPPNTIIPLWDLDGIHVYFKSTDAYGRINPIRKGKVVFEDESQNVLPEGESEASVNRPSGMNPVGDSRMEDMSKYVTKEDFEGLRHEIQDMLRISKPSEASESCEMASQNKFFGNDQNGNKKRG